MGWDGRGCESHPQLHGHVRAHATLNFGRKLGFFKGWCGGSMALGFVGFTRVVLGRDVAALGHRHQLRVAWSDVLPPLGRRNKAFQSALRVGVGWASPLLNALRNDRPCPRGSSEGAEMGVASTEAVHWVRVDYPGVLRRRGRGRL